MGFLNIFLEHYSTISISIFVCVVLAGRMGVRGRLIYSAVGGNVMKVVVAAVLKVGKKTLLRNSTPMSPYLRNDTIIIELFCLKDGVLLQVLLLSGKKSQWKLGMVAHAYNPVTQKAMLWNNLF